MIAWLIGWDSDVIVVIIIIILLHNCDLLMSSEASESLLLYSWSIEFIFLYCRQDLCSRGLLMMETLILLLIHDWGRIITTVKWDAWLLVRLLLCAIRRSWGLGWVRYQSAHLFHMFDSIASEKKNLFSEALLGSVPSEWAIVLCRQLRYLLNAFFFSSSTSLNSALIFNDQWWL